MGSAQLSGTKEVLELSFENLAGTVSGDSSSCEEGGSFCRREGGGKSLQFFRPATTLAQVRDST